MPTKYPVSCAIVQMVRLLARNSRTRWRFSTARARWLALGSLVQLEIARLNTPVFQQVPELTTYFVDNPDIYFLGPYSWPASNHLSVSALLPRCLLPDSLPRTVWIARLSPSGGGAEVVADFEIGPGAC